MTEEIKINQKYVKDFNLGYELAKELNLKSTMFSQKMDETSPIIGVQQGVNQFLRESLLKNTMGIEQNKFEVKPNGRDMDQSM